MSTASQSGDRTLVDILRERAAATPDRTAFIDGDRANQVLTYGALDRRARAIAGALQEHGAAGERTMLLFPPGLDYVAGFLGCLFAGSVPVPVAVPAGRRGVTAIRAIAADAAPVVALGDSNSVAAARSAGAFDGPALDVDEVPDSAASLWRASARQPADLAFLQYTSGSTGTPKGVSVTHANLMHTSAAIARFIDAEPSGHAVSWLPPYHDMGLIGGILQPLYSGFSCTLLAPSTFIRRPGRWLEEMSRTGATMSVAPDFGYLECVRRIPQADRRHLDLSRWQHALVGAEPVRAGTLDAFSRAFAEAGFRPSAFQPCFGLAEATLLVIGARGGATRLRLERDALSRGRVVVSATQPPVAGAVEVVGCGDVQGDDVVIVVDPGTRRPCADGEIGELWVSGPSVAAGYWRRPGGTDSVFRARLAGDGSRTFLRTGDLGFRHAGEFFVTGRRNDVIIIRGRNHHAHDLEQTATDAHSALHPGGAAAFSVEDGAEEGFVVVHEVERDFDRRDHPTVVATIKARLAGEHGITPHDVFLVRRGGIERTTSGKIRRTACRDRWLAGTLPAVAPEAGDRADGEGAARGALAELVATQLGGSVADLRADVPLVALGLDSLRAVRLAERLRDAFHADIALDRLLGGMTVAELEQAVGAAAAPSAPERSGDAPAGADRVPATRAQQWMWLLEQWIGASGACHVVGGVRLAGPLDPELLRRAIEELHLRHAALRSVFTATNGDQVWRRTRAPEPFALPVVDLPGATDTQLRTRIVDLARQRFDLAQGPLLRAVLFRAAPDNWCVGIVAHHILVDGWSLGLLMHDLGDCFRELSAGRLAPPLPARDGPAIDGQEAGSAARAFWQEHLTGAPPLNLPVGRAPDGLPAWSGATVPFKLSTGESAAVRAWAAAHGVTPFMVVLAAVYRVLAEVCDQDDLVVGVPAAGRHRPGGAEQLGLLVNVVPLRLRLSGAAGLAELVDGVRAVWLAASPHQGFPFEESLRLAAAARESGRAPLVRFVVAYQNIPLTPWQAGSLRAEPFELPPPGAQFEMHLRLAATAGGAITGDLLYRADLFEAETSRRIVDRIRDVVRAATGVTDAPVGPEWARLGASADATALCWTGGSMTYGALCSRVEHLSRSLAANGIGQGDRVAIEPDGADGVAGLLAVYGIGAVAAPNAPDTPDAVLSRAGGVRVIQACGPDAPPSHRDGIADITETGVLRTHESRDTWLRRMRLLHPLDPDDRGLVRGAADALWPLTAGATAVLATDAGTSALGQLVTEFAVTVCHLDPPGLRALLDDLDGSVPPALRRIVCGPGPLPSALVHRARAALSAVELHTWYGGEEVGIALAGPVPPTDGMSQETVPVGRPVDGARVTVRDAHGDEVQVGVPGEIWLGGPGMALGYMNSPGRTAERFTPDPAAAGRRLFRTGDRGRWLVDGTLEVSAQMPAYRPTPPRNATECALVEIWRDVLDVDDVSVTDDLFELGGHSLTATRIVMRVRDMFGVDLALSGMLTGRLTIERLADRVEALRLAQPDAGVLAQALAELSELSDEQVAQLLGPEPA
ncbi:AMP-binding protein [Micromonospora sp. NPDC048999]|uniref:AMP-binding protein n=1 Tax=Micromonospora sp. NPDC048999 TaxID=3155391 RepID=UPI003409DA90